jgi:hypothetical protein
MRRRNWLSSLFQTLSQTWIAPGIFAAPLCPVCHTTGVLPNTPVVIANPDGSIGATLAKAKLFICQQCGCMFAGFTT